MKPLLSICIPTYNRAELLRVALLSLVSQVKELGNEVELIVSDNCSPDHTKEVLECTRQYGPIRYNRNDENIGWCRNIIRLTTELAAGEFCWLLGDDDMIIKGKLRKIVEIIKSNPTIDAFFVNYFLIPVEIRNNIILEHDSQYTPKSDECMCRDFSERLVSKWEEILSIDNKIPSNMFTPMLCHITRKSLWEVHAKSLDISSNNVYHTFDVVFPHMKIWILGLIGKPVYYIGDACVLLGQRYQEWMGFWPVIFLRYCNEALDLYENHGVDPMLFRRSREDILKNSGPLLIKMILHPDAPGREYLSVRRFILRYWMDMTFMESLLRAIFSFLRKKIRLS